MKLLSLAIVLACGLISNVAAQRMSDSDIAYLEQYGYMNSLLKGEKYTDDEMKQGLMRFQSFNGMEKTGTMTDEMHAMMNKSRCGLRDIADIPSASPRAKRYVTYGTRWSTLALTYNYQSYSGDLTEQNTRTAIERALKVWSDVTSLTFTEVRKDSSADIEISFTPRYHGDGNDFDGPGRVLAHAYFPGNGIGGDAHFDEDELYTVNGRGGIDLFQVAAHEFGHSLGLAHSEDPQALMAPYYAGYIPDFELPQDDINGIQFLYGSSTDPRPDTPNTDGGSTPDICISNLDAISYDGSGVYIFQGNDVTRLEIKGTRIPGYPKPISNEFRQLVNNIDAAYFRFREETYVFFKGNLYWEFDRNRNLKQGFPRETKLPSDLDAVLSWNDLYTVFTKGDQHWVYDESKKNIVFQTYFRGVPANPDAAFRWLDAKFYFVKEGNYYHYDTSRTPYSVDTNVYPQPFGEDWLSCGPGTYLSTDPNSAAVHVHSFSALLVTLIFILNI
ncbi:matrix metalloproteinase-18-like [Anneissia japonica]|uniref:matrix metalloproteinase-18-like n=1 Tax=Anneissia japonica TaxID=1529436 RepID=UPI0014256CBF|nr:matrix metalloproteinase-18-like [Anneissia japonica]